MVTKLLLLLLGVVPGVTFSAVDREVWMMNLVKGQRVLRGQQTLALLTAVCRESSPSNF